MSDDVDDGRHDFDFLHGKWQITNQRLKERLTGCQDWLEFPAEMETRPILQGLGNYDIMRTTFNRKPFEGLSLRLFSPEARKWSIYWADSVSAVLQPAVVGHFQDDTGIFFCDDQHLGQPVRCCFTWSEITEKTARWEQAFSVDNEQTWETNWVMLFSRVA
ncbi:MAG: hypothetical protein V3T39_09815 [Gammaproteobacteria bacterium]